MMRIDQQGESLWMKTYGGSGEDVLSQGIMTKDGGYLMCGYSFSNDGDVQKHHGTANSKDGWVVKTDALGNVEWTKSLGGSSQDEIWNVIATKDSGYCFIGKTSSSDGDVTSNFGEFDYWVVKTDGKGNILWQKTYGGAKNEEGTAIIETKKNEFIIAGTSFSNDMLADDHHGSVTKSDCWLLKIDSVGDIIWRKSIGGYGYESGYSIDLCSDGSFVVTGHTSSSEGDLFSISQNCNDSTQSNVLNGAYDCYILKMTDILSIEKEKNLMTYGDNALRLNINSSGLIYVTGWASSDDIDVKQHYGNTINMDCWTLIIDSTFNIKWQNTIGGSRNDYGNIIELLSNSDFMIAGNSESGDGNIQNHYGNDSTRDVFISRVDGELGTLKWLKVFGGSLDDFVLNSCKINENHTALIGATESCDIPELKGYGQMDIWRIDVDNSGNNTKQQLFGGSGIDVGTAILKADSGDIVIAGYSNSTDMTGITLNGGYDIVVIKQDKLGEVKWSMAYGGSDVDAPSAIIKSVNGGYILTGATKSTDGVFDKNRGLFDCFVMKLNNSGDIEWAETYGGTYSESGEDLIELKDGSVIIGGWSRSNDYDVSGHHGLPGEPAITDVGDHIADYWLLKVDSVGKLLWQKSLGGIGGEFVSSIKQLPNGNILIAGGSASTDGDVLDQHGNHIDFPGGDYWILEIDTDGNVVRSKCFGGTR